MHGFFLPQASIELCRSQNSGMEPARRHEDGLSSPYQNALCSAFTRKKGRLFPGTLARPRPATEAPQRKGKASLALRRASRALALRPLSAAGRTRDAWLREKGFWPSFSPKGGENDLFWHQFSGQSRLKEGLVCPGRCQPSALKKSRFFVLPSEPL